MAVEKEKGKRQRGAATSARILTAATKLFGEHGYLDTTMAAIAAEAEVSVQTLYLRYGSKAAILSAALDLAVAGDLEPVALMDRDWPKAVLTTEDPAAAIRLLVTRAIETVSRVSPVFAVIQAAAADPEVAELLARNKRERFAAMTTIAEALSRRKGFARKLSPARAADLLYAALAEEVHRLFVVERGWTQEEWTRWTTELLVGQLVPGAAGSK